MEITHKYMGILFTLLFLALSLILYIHVPPGGHKDIDSQAYQEKAELFCKTGQLEEQGTSPIVQQPVGYPLFMGTIYKIFGINEKILIWIQILLTLLAGILLFFATRRLFGPLTAIIAYGLFSVNIGFIVFAQFILAETLMLFFLVLFLERFLYFVKTSKIHSLVVSGASLGISTLVKPGALYFIAPLLLVFVPFVFLSKQNSILKNIGIIAAFTFSFMAPINLHQAHNYFAHGSKNFTPHGNYNLYVCFWGKIRAEQRGETESSRYLTRFREEQKKLSDMIEGNPLEERSWKALKAAFWAAVLKNPFLFIKTWIREMIQTWGGLYTTNLKVLLEPTTKGGDVSFFESKGTFFKKICNYICGGTTSTNIKVIGLMEFLWNILRTLLVIFAMLFLLVRKEWFLFFFFAAYLGYFSLVTGFDGHARYRMMIEFVLIMLSAVSIKLLLYDRGKWQNNFFMNTQTK